MERGLLTGKYQDGSHLAADDHRRQYFSRFDMAAVNKLISNLRGLAEKYNASLSQLVLAWTFHQPAVAAALAGARNAKQAEENAKALQISISTEDLQLIRSWLPEKAFV
jgi:aryl-alcohol dehydrogenase-like predicted oxidoreductase